MVVKGKNSNEKIFLVIVFYSTVCLAVPMQPTDKSSFSPTIPTILSIKDATYAVPRSSDL